ncbi:lycopene cyclase family protein [Flavihumibacter stibioxidans]|uniref:Lycopene beta-cyclase n=1 Tax=Flavihumibacter stibioxidans TaxID=1834163 RepID=A0ABR7M7P6_9BACT|nr:lycopene cyclase family protein [Flavihumibacter stibioxidans]MBC6491002.1 hypothetical protein [Flavihumibacter stibioxidans]
MPSDSLFRYKPFEYKYQFDYIFAGAGAASLSLLIRMLQCEQFRDRTFLIVDRDRKSENDRTWCYWEKGEGFFDSLVFKKWDKTWFHGEGFSKQFNMAPYQYKMIRGIDFYTFCLNYLKKQANVTILFEPVARVYDTEHLARLVLHNGETYSATRYLFNSIPFVQPEADLKTQLFLQHFKGWVVETDQPFFDPGSNTLMDFRMDQQHGTTFVYTMPLDEKKALVEYTLFSKTLLPAEAYDEGLRNYIRDYLKLDDYRITEQEFGVIPMTNYQYPQGEGRLVNIGTAGGQTKASSGYTFQFIQKHSHSIIDSMLMYGHPRPESYHSGRYRFYDRVLLDVMSKGELSGAEIFTRLFRRNPIQRIFRFLDNDSWLPEELLLIGSLPTMPFLRAALGR